MKISEIQVSYINTESNRCKIGNSKEAYEVIISNWNKKTIELQEEFMVILLNRANHTLGIYPLSKGGVAGTVIDPKLIFSVALKCNASSVIMVHNHPSGNLRPSRADTLLTERLKKAGDLLDIQVIDHLIISKAGYYSFADEGQM